MRTLSTIALFVGAALLPSVSGAQEAGGVSLSGNIAVVSDYRYRGYSLTDRDPALQGELTGSLASGLYAYGWASSIHDAGDDIELMAALGWAGDLPGGFSLDAGGGAYFYPGLSDSTLYEVYAIVSRKLGMATLTGELDYMPEQTNLGDQSNTYARLGAETPFSVAKLSAFAGIGWEDGAFGDNKIDWNLGIAAPFDPFEFRLSYVDTDLAGVKNAESTILAELRFKFSR